MATLTIRNLDAALKERLRIRAAQHGHSMEAELREILQQTLKEPERPEVDLYQRTAAGLHRSAASISTCRRASWLASRRALTECFCSTPTSCSSVIDGHA